MIQNTEGRNREIDKRIQRNSSRNVERDQINRDKSNRTGDTEIDMDNLGSK